MLLLDAGDLTYSAQPVSVFFDGDLDITLYNWLKYDAAAIGNNEFQRGAPMLRSQMKKAAFPFLGANVKYTGGPYVGEPWIIKNFDGLRVAIFGLLTAGTAEVTPAEGVIIGNEAAAGKR